MSIKETIFERRNNKPYVIAEIGNNHMGSLILAKEMVRLASLCGVNAVKFQKRNNKFLYAKEFYQKEYTNNNSFAKTYGEHREFLELSKEDFVEIIDYAHSLNMDIIITIFDEISLEEMRALDFDAFKIASGDITNIPLIKKTAEIGKPILISTGYADFNDIDRAVNNIYDINKNIVVMYCVSQYPTTDKNLHLNIIDVYKKRYKNLIIGFSSHEIGEIGSLIAYSHGATIIERHFTISNSLKGTDQKFSLNINNMKKLVEDLERAHAMFGAGTNKVKHSYEHEAVQKMRKGVYAKNNIYKGQIIKKSDLSIKSPETEIEPYEIGNIIGTIALNNYCAEERIPKEQIKYGKSKY